jgi:hypothetical protein
MTTHQCGFPGCGAPATTKFRALHARDAATDPKERKGCIHIDKWACNGHYSAMLIQCVMVLQVSDGVCPHCGKPTRILTDLVQVVAVVQQPRGK